MTSSSSFSENENKSADMLYSTICWLKPTEKLSRYLKWTNEQVHERMNKQMNDKKN